jgi:AbrB family looped-hinge helix DNA binding protein
MGIFSTAQYFLDSRILRLKLAPVTPIVAKQHFAQARVTRKYQINLPSKLREALGPVTEGDYILFYRDGDRVYLELGSLRPKNPRT